MNQDLRINSIKNQLEYQENRHAEISSELSSHKNKVDQLKSDLTVTDTIIKTLNNELSAHGISRTALLPPAPIPALLISKIPDRPILSSNYTLKLIDKSGIKNGPQAKDIVDDYEKLDINTNQKTMWEHFRELLNQELIYQTNPDAQRGKRFKVVEKKSSDNADEELDNFEFDEDIDL